MNGVAVGRIENILKRARRFPATHILVALSVVIFLAMILSGVSPVAPGSRDLLFFGADQPDLVAGGEHWRLITAAFVHVGFIHLFFNMWCLWNLGFLGEPLVGAWGLVGIYLITAISGNVLSTAVSLTVGKEAIGAGASGAVFGIAGALIVLLSNKKLPVPWEELKRIRGKVIQFAILNLAIGASTYFLGTSIQIDNLAHLGGVVSGLLLGLFIMPAMTQGRRRYFRRQTLTFVSAGCLLFFLCFIFLRPR